MRDPKRIPKVLEAIQKLWEKHPDWRLGQLLINVIGSEQTVWFCEDYKLLEAIGEMEKGHGAPRTKTKTKMKDQTINDLEDQGYLPWNNHPGYTIDYLNKMLAQYQLAIETKEVGEAIWFKVVKI